ncbi:uncharacterized protein LOC114179400 isoform X5 [Vigna unguiculata]|uniref:uncharacterized protein LOC114179400 isoform X5 n=1 Tax=Vigna unguiculata TaxID=3917 RepID=UPI00101682E2|nr:uncharacterized protein LOC114179400 isoform X5 [Vigna unguiculata]
MDYDDNDFQSQNLHIPGEGSTKFPPVLRPYALPKFDLDESLQGHLRFDSLVETEVFLGIESNEDNQWIDAYSRGSSGIEFGSTAAESCSISRHNNVWSEATSSESVEMLLKSVGQEEFIPRETDIQESDAFDELACLAKQMEPDPKPDDTNEYKDNVTDLQPPGFIHENLVGLKEEEREQSLAVVSQGELSIDGGLGNLQPHDLLGNVDLPVARGIPITDDNSDDANQQKVEIVADGSLEEKTQEDSAASWPKNSITVTSIQNISSTCDVLKIQNVQNHVVDMDHEDQSSLQMQSNEQDLDSLAINKDSDVDIRTSNLNAVGGEKHHSDKPLCSIPMEEALESGNVVEGLDTSDSSLGGSLGMVSDDISRLQNTGSCNEDACFRDLSPANANEDTIVDNLSAVNTCDSPIVAIKDDSSSEGQIIGVSKSDHSTYPNFQKNNTVAPTHSKSSDSKENELANIGNQMDVELSFSKSEASIFAVGNDNTSTINKSDDDIKAGGFASLSSVNSTTSCILVQETQVCENNEPDKQGDHGNFCRDISGVDLANKNATTDSSVMNCNVDQPHHVDCGVSSSSLSTDNMETKLTTATVSDVEPVNNSDSQYILENISLTSCEMADVTLPNRVISTHGVTDHFEVQGGMLVGSASINEKDYTEATIANEASAETTLANEASAEATVTNEASTEATVTNEASAEAKICIELCSEGKRANECSSEAKIVNDVSSEAKIVNDVSSEAKIAYEASSALPVGSSEQETASCLDTGTEKLHFSDTSRQPLNETISSCVTTASGKMDKPQEAPSDKADQECAKEAGVGLVLHESIEKQGDEVSLSFTKDDKEAIQEFHDKSSSKITGEDLSGNEGSKSSSLPDSCTKLHETGSSPANHTDNARGTSVTFRSQPETEKDVNRVKASGHLNPSISECVNKDALNTSMGHDPKGNDASNDEISLAPVANLPKKSVSGKTSKGTNSGKRQRAAANQDSMVGEELASVVGTSKTKVAGNMSRGSPQISDGVMALTVSQGTPERKPRRSSNKTAGKETSRKGNKGKSPGKHSERVDRSTSLSLSPSPGFQVMQLNEVQQYGHVDYPFMDIQQIQLRAQIFVYGALIQGMVPDEAYMISAFGGPDGGRSIWQNAWSSCMERQHGKKSHPINPETPLQSRSDLRSAGARTTDVAVKQNALQGISSPLGVTGNKATPTIGNPLVPLSSPLWSLQTPSCDSLQNALARGSVVDYSQALASSQYQTPPFRNFLGHNTSWLSQSPLRGSWTPIPASDNNTSHISALPLTDTIQFNSVKGSSVPPSIKNAPLGLPASSAGVQSLFMATTPLHDTNNVMVLNAQHSSDPKPIKRKKSMVSEDLGLKAMHLQSQLVPTPVVSSHISTSVATATPVGSVPITTVEKSVVSVTPLSLAEHLTGEWNVKMRILSDESLTKIKEARENAEEASALSVAAVNHSLEIWKQLDKQKNSGLVSDIEAKLASAAVAVAAAAAVAKAAAAAANVASNAALHAKLMADEALVSSGYESSCQISCSEGMNNVKATPASILKGTIGTNSSSSIIGAAKEAARKRVEAASAARIRAENMDAIVKAAELAAEAVSQAGKIVTMGDPLALNDLIEAGPEGCWNAARESSQQVGLLKDMTSGLFSAGNIGDRPEASQIRNRDISSDEKGKKTAAREKSPFHTAQSEISQDHMKGIGGISSINVNEKSSKGPNLVNPIDVLPESEIEMQVASTAGNRPEDVEEDSIKEGSLVEVFKDGEGFKAAWYKAKVLSVKDGKAYVSYDFPVDDEGAGPLKEWVSLEGEEYKPPRIRIASNITGLRNEGTRKRQRAAMVDYNWSVGDRVDAWVEDSWQEGVITGQNKNDKTITVHFPVSGKTSLFRAWHLRQSFIWKDGKWVEAPKAGANDSSTHEGDTPHEKRVKLGSPAVEVKGKDRILKGTTAVESANPGELRLLDLTENEKVFNIGKNSKNENKSDAHRMVRTGLPKEGSRGIFGIPKPGKKRKFMEVSKHYVADGTSKINDGNDSVKLSNFLIPQGTGGSRGLKNTSKNDTKEKHGAGSRPAFKSGKQQSVSGRVIPPKENTLSTSRTNDMTNRAERIKDSSSNFKNVSQSENQVERASYSGNIGAGVGPILYSSLESLTDSHPTKKTSTSRASKGKLAPAGGGRLAKIDEEKAFNGNPVKSTSDIAEPRRSNRRIQPTSRLLEGLQSSLIISKIPSASHEKGHKNQNRNVSRG